MNIPVARQAELRSSLRFIFNWLKTGELPQTELLPRQESLGLEKTPIVLLSSLAPGADQLAATEALALGIQVRCPLPFPHPLYRQASTFIRANSDPAANQERLHDYDALVAEIGDHNLFHVLCAEDLSLDATSLQAVLKADLDVRDRRNLRYRAAGEYISAHCDILIAVCGQEKETDVPHIDADLPPLAQAGAQHIVHSHLNGLEPGILPLNTALSWADNGPVFRIYCPKDGEPSKSSVPIAIWHPRDSAIPGQFEPEFEKKWQVREMESLHQFARHLESLNLELGDASGNQSGALLSEKAAYRPVTTLDLFGKAACSLWKTLVCFFNKIVRFFRPARPVDDKTRATPAPAPPVSPRQENIARTRRAVANRNYHYDAKIKNLGLGFLLSFLLAVLGIQLFENLPVVRPAEPPVAVWRSLVFLGAALLVIGCYVARRLYQQRGYFDRQIDYRALAEGLRVQFYWSVAGLSQSVATHYLQRLRGETSWIRAAIAAVSSPQHDDVLAFRKFSAQEQNARLRAISGGWLGEQLLFFSGATHRQSLRRQRVGTIGLILLFAGITVIVANAIQIALPPAHADQVLITCRCTPPWLPLAWWMGGAVAIWLSVQIITRQAYRAFYDLKQSNFWVEASNFLRHGHHWAYHLVAGVLLGGALLSLVVCHPDSEEVKSFGSILKNLLIAGYVAATAYNLFKHADENTKRYSAMRDLFRAAKDRMDRLLDQHQQAIDTRNESEQNRLLLAIQQHLSAIGQEALHEQTDWLQMHRIKPIEPVLPIG